MNSNTLCPISINKIDENIARLNGFFTILFLALYLATQNIIPILFLLFDFSMRGLELSKYSLLANISKYIVDKFKISKKPVNAGPKIFAARIGVLFNILILASILFNFDTATYTLISIFGVCAFLESAFRFCVACQIYPIVYKLTYKPKSSLN